MRLLNFILLIFAFAVVLLKPFDASAKTEHLVYFENTDYELHVYKIYGLEKGKTLMIIGGIQGDEPGGYLAADLYADMALRKGNLIVVPRANFLSIIENKRAINGDMNRRFSKDTKEYYEDRVVKTLKGVMGESDYFLNLHEGSGFYSEEWKSELINHDRFGQSIIADSDIYKTSGDMVIDLAEIARAVTERVNVLIEDKMHHFKFNNHRTFESDTRHPEQRGSATFFALSTYNIPAFGIETSKEIRDLEMKVRYQTMVINAFMDELGIIRENPKIALDPPKLDYIIVSVNGSETVMHNGSELMVRKGDRIKVVEIEANYKRGLSVDISGIGTANDLKKEFLANGPLTVTVRKDGFNCGKVRIAVTEAEALPYFTAASTTLKCLILEVNGARHILKDGENINIVRGDLLRIGDAIVGGISPREIKANFLGFVGNASNNTGDDKGYVIDTGKDLWIKYSEGMKDKRYTIAMTRKGAKIGTFHVDIDEPKMDYIVIRQNKGERRCYSSGDIITISPNDTIEVADIKTNVTGNAGVKVYIGDLAGKAEKIIDVGDIISSVNGSSSEYRLLVKRERILLGEATIKVSGPIAKLDVK